MRLWLAYIRTWRVFLAFWRQKWTEHAAATQSVRVLFQPLDAPSNFLLNLISYNLFFVSLIIAAGFSSDFCEFASRFIILPSLLGGVTYYYYRFGKKLWVNLSAQTISKYANNFVAMLGISLVSWTMNAVVHCVVLLLVDWCPFLPNQSFSFPLHTTELYLRRCVYCFYGVMGLLMCTLPMWVEGYRAYTTVTDRAQLKLSHAECALEIFYFASQSSSALQVCVPMLVLFSQWGIRFYMLHLVIGMLEIVFSNMVSMVKECVHEIRPLFAMAHAEHHICKGTYATTAGFGLWEFFLLGNTIGFSVVVSGSPYIMLQLSYGGANLIVHTMFPQDFLLMHHSLHHVIASDFYSGGVPSVRDRMFSKHLLQYNAKLETKSFFCRSEMAWTNDAIAFGMIMITSALSHYFLGWTIFSVWDQIQWSN